MCLLLFGDVVVCVVLYWVVLVMVGFCYFVYFFFVYVDVEFWVLWDCDEVVFVVEYFGVV